MASGFSAAEGLGTSQLRRFFLPGLIAAVGLHHYLPPRLLHELGETYGLTSTVLLIGEVILFGLLISSATIPIFHLYEGFLLPWLTKPAKIWNEWRVDYLGEKLRKLYANKALDEISPRDYSKIVKIESVLSDFPIQQYGDSYIYEVERSTRLGNIIATYELYAERRYGIDGVFFWFHLAHLAPEVSRDDFQENAVLAESVLLASAAGALVALAAVCIQIGFIIGGLFPSITSIVVPASRTTVFVSMMFGLSVFFIFYLLSWTAHRAVGKSFCALVDLAMPAFQDWAMKAPIPLPEKLKTRAARLQRYLEILDLEQEAKESGEEDQATVEESPNPGPQADS